MSAPAMTTYKTECLLCHGVQHNPPLNIEPDKQQQPRAVTEFIEKLLRHIGKRHLPELTQGKNLLAQYQVFLILSQFESEDPSVQAVLNGMRADIFQRCRKNIPTDMDLEILLARCETRDDYYQAMRALRDLCCETGPHAPQLP